MWITFLKKFRPQNKAAIVRSCQQLLKIDPLSEVAFNTLLEEGSTPAHELCQLLFDRIVYMPKNGDAWHQLATFLATTSHSSLQAIKSWIGQQSWIRNIYFRCVLSGEGTHFMTIDEVEKLLFAKWVCSHYLFGANAPYTSSMKKAFAFHDTLFERFVAYMEHSFPDLRY